MTSSFFRIAILCLVVACVHSSHHQEKSKRNIPQRRHLGEAPSYPYVEPRLMRRSLDGDEDSGEDSGYKRHRRQLNEVDGGSSNSVTEYVNEFGETVKERRDVATDEVKKKKAQLAVVHHAMTEGDHAGHHEHHGKRDIAAELEKKKKVQLAVVHHAMTEGEHAGHQHHGKRDLAAELEKKKAALALAAMGHSKNSETGHHHAQHHSEHSATTDEEKKRKAALLVHHAHHDNKSSSTHHERRDAEHAHAFEDRTEHATGHHHETVAHPAAAAVFAHQQSHQTDPTHDSQTRKRRQFFGAYNPMLIGAYPGAYYPGPYAGFGGLTGAFGGYPMMGIYGRKRRSVLSDGGSHHHHKLKKAVKKAEFKAGKAFVRRHAKTIVRRHTNEPFHSQSIRAVPLMTYAHRRQRRQLGYPVNAYPASGYIAPVAPVVPMAPMTGVLPGYVDPTFAAAGYVDPMVVAGF